MKVAILYFQNINAPMRGDDTYISNLSCSLTDRGHRVKVFSIFGTPSRISLWDDRFKRTVYSASLWGKTAELSRYDIVLFTEPLFPYSMMLLRYLKLRTKAHIILYVGVPRITNGSYFLLIKNKFPAMISGENARPFAESIAPKVGLVPPGIDTARLHPQDTNKMWDLLYIGHLYKEKGVLLLLQAMKLLKNNNSPLKLKIICTPNVEEKFYRCYIQQNGLDNVDMERAIIKDHVSVYNSARAFVYPGISYNRVAEVPLTIMEASACGLPVVTTSMYRHIKLPNITFSEPEVKALADAIIQATDSWNMEKQQQTLNMINSSYSLASLGSRAESFFTEVIDGR
ncbi:glycosyltransferase [Chloroflexota bacterium]